MFCVVNCLKLFLGKPVLLEQPKKGGVRLVSHVLYSHGGTLHEIHSYSTCNYTIHTLLMQVEFISRAFLVHVPTWMTHPQSVKAGEDE